MTVVFARLRPDRVAAARELTQHLIHPAASDTRVVATWCGFAFDTIDLDPAYAYVMSGAPCAGCVVQAPIEFTVGMQQVSGELSASPQLAASTDPVGDFVYASCLAGLELRHIVPTGASRFPYSGRHVVVVECGHMAWCPRLGPFPSRAWPVCVECVEVFLSHTAMDVSPRPEQSLECS